MNTTSNDADLIARYNRITNLLYINGFLVEAVLGIIGSVLGCIVFCQKTMRANSSAIYFIVFYITNFLFISLCWMPVIIRNITNYSASGHSVPYCKISMYFTYAFPAIARYCVVFAAINRTMATSSNALTRRRNTHRFAYLTIIGIVLLVGIYYVFVLVGTDVYRIGSSGPVCTIVPGIYTYLIPISPIVINTCVPLTVMAIFAILTLKNLRARRVQPTNTVATTLNTQQPRDRQFTILVLAEVAVYVLFVPWSGIFSTYQQGTQTMYKTAQQKALEELLLPVLSIVNYVPPTVSFYQNLLVSKAFRQKTKEAFFSRCQRRPLDGSNHHVSVPRTANQSKLQ